MKKSIVIDIYDGEFTKTEEFEYKDDFTILDDDGIVYFRLDGILKFGVNKELFKSFITKETGR